MTNRERKQYGNAAIEAGSPDGIAVDALANVLHAIGDARTAEDALRLAWTHFITEHTEPEQ